MKKIAFLITTFLIISCVKNSSEISNEFNCAHKEFKNLEEVNDLKGLFSIKLPKNWNINLYQDKVQSSIFAADTTKQLTQTFLIDATFIHKNIIFDDLFLLKQEQQNLAKGFIKVKNKRITLLKKPSIYTIYKGKRGKFFYQICNIFIKLNDQNSMHIKTKIFGDSLVKERVCNSFKLIENIKINQ